MTSNELLINKVVESQLNRNHPEFRTGDTVKIHLKIKEGSKERIQIFEGFILKRSKRSNADATFTVRKESYGIGVEKTFFLNSPSIVKIEIVKLGKVRQSKIFYMRDRKGKSARIKPRSEKNKKTDLTKKESKKVTKKETNDVIEKASPDLTKKEVKSKEEFKKSE